MSGVNYLMNLNNLDSLLKLELKWIKGYEGLYAVCNSGDIYSFSKTIPFKLKATKNKDNGYLYVMLQSKGAKENLLVHRIVAEYFVKNQKPEEYSIVNHLDENKENPFYLNLQWCTTLQNNQYSLKNGYIVTFPDGVEENVVSLRAFALAHKLDPSGMTKVAKGKQKNHKGFKVRYK